MIMAAKSQPLTTGKTSELANKKGFKRLMVHKYHHLNMS